MPDHPAPIHPDVRYEKKDTSVATIVICALVLIFILALVHGALDRLYVYLQRAEQRENRQTHPLAPLAAKERPRLSQLPDDLKNIPAPVLQSSETPDLKRLRLKEEARLHSYGWIGQNGGKVHMPIGEAMKLLADPDFAKAHGIRVAVPKKENPR